MSKIHIPTPLRQYVGKQSTVEVTGSTVGEALTALVEQHPELRRHLYTEDGRLRAFVNLYVNDEDIRYLQKEATVVNAGDSISIVPSIAGGTLILRSGFRNNIENFRDNPLLNLSCLSLVSSDRTHKPELNRGFYGHHYY
jgi:sulfur-carrier protein